MGYSYGGDAHERLFASYQEDSEPLPTGTPMGFPQREHGREEVDILKRLFFPTCWNEVALVRDELAILERLDALGELFDSGIQPYSGGDPSFAEGSFPFRADRPDGRDDRDTTRRGGSRGRRPGGRPGCPRRAP